MLLVCKSFPHLSPPPIFKVDCFGNIQDHPKNNFEGMGGGEGQKRVFVTVTTSLSLVFCPGLCIKVPSIENAHL